ncbi:MAG: class I SAM-dependent methyltransferase [Thermoplasmatales archaeon]|nr:MAG: class I SAM-dependent methyltransferase [Thermoplasmatales archaeon]
MVDNHVKIAEKTWDAIAESFDVTRRKPWCQCIDFINGLSESYTVADIGCGNGRHLLPCAERFKNVIGIDISQNLLNIAKNKIKEKGFNNVVFIHANMTKIPLKDDSLDSILCIASLHNIKGRNERLSSLKEIYRILKNDGRALISVWSRWQDKYITHYLKKLFHNKEEFGDIEIYWKQHNINISRFYHLYSKREFVKNLNQVGLEIEKIQSVKLHSNIFTDNYFAVVRKGKLLLR